MSSNRLQLRIQKIQANIQQGDLAAAQKTVQGLLRKHPRELDVVFLAGQVCGMRGDHAEAERIYQTLSYVKNLPAPFFFNLGFSQAQQGHLDDAVASYTQALKLDSANPKYLSNIATCLIDLNRYDDAQKWIQQWIDCDPNDAVPLLHQAICFQADRSWDEAAAAYEYALDHGAPAYQCQLNLSVVYKEQGNLLAAISAAEQTLVSKPRCPITTYNLASFHQSLGDIDKAKEYFNSINRLSIPDDLCLKVDAGLLYALNLQPNYDPVSVFEAHREWGETKLKSSASSLSEAMLQRLADSPERLRVGFISEGFHQHPIGFFMTSLLATLDSSRIVSVLIAQIGHPDEVTDTLKQHCDEWLDITQLNNSGACQAIEAASLDILIDLDTHTSGRIDLLTTRHAPVQASYLGYANTSGLHSIDYRITDDYVDPVGDEVYYTERLMRLSRPFFCYQPPDLALEAAEPTGSTAGIIFGSFSKAEKINDRVIQLWSRILQSVPDSKLLLQMALLSQDSGQDWVKQRFAAEGIGPERLIMQGWAPLETYLKRHREVDLILDTVPWNGHTNTCHGLWMGVPTLTLEEAHFSGRFGALIMKQVGCDELVVDTEDAFVAKAQQLAADRPKLTALRQSIRSRLLASPLCDGEDFALQMTAAFEQMWAEQQQRQLTAQ